MGVNNRNRIITAALAGLLLGSGASQAVQAEDGRQGSATNPSSSESKAHHSCGGAHGDGAHKCGAGMKCGQMNGTEESEESGDASKTGTHQSEGKDSKNKKAAKGAARK